MKYVYIIHYSPCSFFFPFFKPFSHFIDVQSTSSSNKSNVTPPPPTHKSVRESDLDNVEFDSLPGFREAGQVPTNYEVAAGPERYEYLKKLAGEEPWEEMYPIYLSAKGTVQKPILVEGVDPERYIGCSGK